MQKVIFLDRDGVINSDIGHYYIYKPEDFILNDGVVDVLKKWQNRGYKFVVITNQGGVARGTYSKKDVEKVHAKLLSLLNKENITIEEIYYCPHHSDMEKCLCRKPGSLMLEKAIARFNIDVKNSWMIGDNQKDIIAAENAGIKGIKIESNQNLNSIVDIVK